MDMMLHPTEYELSIGKVVPEEGPPVGFQLFDGRVSGGDACQCFLDGHSTVVDKIRWRHAHAIVLAAAKPLLPLALDSREELLVRSLIQYVLGVEPALVGLKCLYTQIAALDLLCNLSESPILVGTDDMSG